MGKGKHILQLDYNTGEIIEEYPSIEEAAHDNWMSREMLSKVLRKYDGFLRKKELRFKFKEAA